MILWLLGCVTLSTWERAGLMTRVMQDPLDPGAARFEQHVLDTREAMAGAADAGGAPCGCN
jgi:hypothetical protein